MKTVSDLVCGSPSSHLLNLRRENQKKVDFAKETIQEVEEFLQEYKKYLVLLERIQEILDSEKID